MKKGEYGGLCNRSACLAPGATWMHLDNKSYYCRSCARLINFENRHDEMVKVYGGKLLVEVNSHEGVPSVVRFVVTHIGRDGMRTLAMACQGRYTYDTPYPAHQWIKDATKNNSADTLRSVFGSPPSLEVRPVECWPVHFDPKGVYFD